jgi:hypothetical protein
MKKKNAEKKGSSHGPECWKRKEQKKKKKKRNGPRVSFSGGGLNAREIITKDQIRYSPFEAQAPRDPKLKKSKRKHVFRNRTSRAWIRGSFSLPCNSLAQTRTHHRQHASSRKDPANALTPI